ncbi:YuiA family protein [Tepidibacillus infernus]|nr:MULTISPECIES: YuiA family protein [Tepidibacillus]GBF10326.1 hypothetical protein HK1_00338 [Tepidibacillus sp. HK-1]
MKGYSDHICEYCEGQGYYDLLEGGSETCPACEGTGKQGEEEVA